jgi:hypothetical protein
VVLNQEESGLLTIDQLLLPNPSDYVLRIFDNSFFYVLPTLMMTSLAPRLGRSYLDPKLDHVSLFCNVLEASCSVNKAFLYFCTNLLFCLENNNKELFLQPSTTQPHCVQSSTLSISRISPYLVRSFVLECNPNKECCSYINPTSNTSLFSLFSSHSLFSFTSLSLYQLFCLSCLLFETRPVRVLTFALYFFI